MLKIKARAKNYFGGKSLKMGYGIVPAKTPLINLAQDLLNTLNYFY
jgi:hypothetical protein